jgi:tetratricopeptide (TPR) repeat protein
MNKIQKFKLESSVKCKIVKFSVYLFVLSILFSASPCVYAASEFLQQSLIHRYATADEIYWKDITKANKHLIDNHLLDMILVEYQQFIKYANDTAEKNKKRRVIPSEAYVLANLHDYIAKQLNKTGNVRFTLANEYLKDGAYNISADICNNIIISEPNNIKAATLKASLFMKMAMYQEAMETYQKIIAMDKNNPEALYYLGILNTNLGQYDKAAEMFRRLLKIQPQNDEARRFLNLYDGKTSTSSGNSPKINDVAIQHFMSAEKLFMSEKFEEAANEYSLAIENDPRFYKAYAYLGECLTRQKKYKDAEQILGHAIQLNPNEPEAYHFLGLCNEKQYNFDPRIDFLQKALDNYNKATKVAPNYEPVKEDLLRVNKKMEGITSKKANN